MVLSKLTVIAFSSIRIWTLDLNPPLCFGKFFLQRHSNFNHMFWNLLFVFNMIHEKFPVCFFISNSVPAFVRMWFHCTRDWMNIIFCYSFLNACSCISRIHWFAKYATYSYWWMVHIYNSHLAYTFFRFVIVWNRWIVCIMNNA